MATSSLIALLDDIASVLDDVAVLTKTAAKKTAGVLGDDLALNAQQVSGVSVERELPVVWAVAKGSFRNKLILLPIALIISAWAPWAVTPLLMIGGAFLCYEGFEKLAHRLLHTPQEDAAAHQHHVQMLANPAIDLLALEKQKIKGAIRTDFILSAEIVAITLGTVATATFLTRFTVLAGVAILMTIGVYGLVAGIVKLDDGGLYLSRQTGFTWWRQVQRSLGRGILRIAPYLMKALSVAGTAAMFLVGGSILVHGMPWLHDWPELLAATVATLPVIGGLLAAFVPTALDAVIGVVAGALVLIVVTLFSKHRLGLRNSTAKLD